MENIPAQFAYSRGYDAFFAGQRVFMDIPPKKRSSLAYVKQTQDVTALYTEAYSAIQVAFEGHLSDSQREKAIEIMAAIAHLFMQSGLVSPLEANYWTTLMVEQVNQKEYEELLRKLSQPASGIFGFLARLNCRRRKRQLGKALVRMERKIQLIEQNISFVTPPRVRKEATGGIRAYNA